MLVDEHGLTLRAVAAEIGCSYEAVRSWKSGASRPHRMFWPHLERLLGRPIDVLMLDADEHARQLRDELALYDEKASSATTTDDA